MGTRSSWSRWGRTLLLASTCLASQGYEAAGGAERVPLASIRAPFSGSDIVVSTSTRTAGAIDSVKWNGQEFIDAFDHGRELQSSSSFDGKGGCYNPTEAGSISDGVGPATSSKLVEIQAHHNVMETKTVMAFWVALGGKRCPSETSNVPVLLSNQILQKTVRIGTGGIPNAIDYKVTFAVLEDHQSATYELATAYMPIDFSVFRIFRPETGQLFPLTKQAGEQAFPIVFSTPSDAFAMGIYCPPSLNPGPATYGRFDFSGSGKRGSVVKWNAVYREAPSAKGDKHFECLTFVGTTSDVTSAMSRSYQEFH